MALPECLSNGLLPAGIHEADLGDVRDRFVTNAPHEEHRRLLFDALHTYFGLLRRHVPSGRAWIDGGFVTHKEQAPHDIDVVVHPSDWATLESLSEQEWNDLLGLLTHQDLIVGSLDPPEWWARLQPVGGALDAFLCWPGQERVWEQTWASVKGSDGQIVPGSVKGFVEVSW